ncbi:MAG: transposase [Bacteroidota bacterium]
MQFTHFIGIDVSKSYLDWSIVHNAQEVHKQRTPNHSQAIQTYVQQYLEHFQIDLAQCLFCIEYTGRYNLNLIDILEKQQATIWQVSPLHLKRSIGIQRGKSDPIDAHRIALFAMRHQDERVPHQRVRPILSQLKSLFALRRALVKFGASIKMQLADIEFIEPSIRSTLQTHIEQTIEQNRQYISELETQMIQLIHDDIHLSRLFLILNSVTGVGPIVSIKLLLATNEFKRMRNPRKLACHAGIAPFEHTSGTSVRKTTRVSNMADHELKDMLHLAALAAIRAKGELRDYYLRKKQENKPSMSILNAVRNKIVHRLCACIKADRTYKKDYQPKLKVA